MKRIETNNKSRADLEMMHKAETAKLLKLKFDLNESKLKDVSQIKKTKKDIARIMTALKIQNSK